MNSIEKLNKLSELNCVQFLAGGVKYSDFEYKTLKGFFPRPVRSEFDAATRNSIALEIGERAGLEEQERYKTYCSELLFIEDLEHIEKVDIYNWLQSRTNNFQQEFVNELLSIFEKYPSEGIGRIEKTKRLAQNLNIDLEEDKRLKLEGKRLMLYNYAVEILNENILRDKQGKQIIAFKKQNKKGRTTEVPLREMINGDVDNRLKVLHKLIDGKKGKSVALVILAAIKAGWMQRPTFTQVANEFMDIGSKTGYNRYMNEKRFTKADIEGALNSLK